MNLNELREAVRGSQHIRHNHFHVGNPLNLSAYQREYNIKTLKLLETLAEDVIRLQGVMPEKIKVEEINLDYADDKTIYVGEEWNDCLDACILAQAGKETVK